MCFLNQISKALNILYMDFKLNKSEITKYLSFPQIQSFPSISLYN